MGTFSGKKLREDASLPDFVEGFLSNYPDLIHEICRSLRDTAKHELKRAQEFLFYDTITYSLSNSPLDRVCYIKPLQNKVTLGFLYGSGLDDPDHLLRGTGKEARSIELKTLQDTKNSSLKELLKAAWAAGPDSVASKKQLVSRQRAGQRRRAGTHRRTQRTRRTRTIRR